MLELFGGSCTMAHVFASSGWTSESFELDRDPRENLLLPRNVRHVKFLIKGKMVDFVWIGIPCGSWSRARRAPLKSKMPSPLRGDTADTILGLPGLSALDQARVEGGNRTANFVADIVKLCVRWEVPCVVENPQSSRLWQSPQFGPIRRFANITTFSQCGFGTPWRKNTTLWCFNVDFGDVGPVCRMKSVNGKRVCGFTQVPHTRLSGAGKGGILLPRTHRNTPHDFARKCRRIW